MKRLTNAEILVAARKIQEAQYAAEVLKVVDDLLPEATEIDIEWDSEYNDEGGYYAIARSVVLSTKKQRLYLSYDSNALNGEDYQFPEVIAEKYGAIPMEDGLPLPSVEDLIEYLGGTDLKVATLRRIVTSGDPVLFREVKA